MKEYLKLIIKDSKIKELIAKSFTASKTSLNGLNFLSKEEESNLLKTEQKQEIINVLKLIYLYLSEDFSQFTNINLVENLLGSICLKNHVSSLSNNQSK